MNCIHLLDACVTLQSRLPFLQLKFQTTFHVMSVCLETHNTYEIQQRNTPQTFHCLIVLQWWLLSCLHGMKDWINTVKYSVYQRLLYKIFKPKAETFHPNRIHTSIYLKNLIVSWFNIDEFKDLQCSLISFWSQNQTKNLLMSKLKTLVTQDDLILILSYLGL